MPSENGSEIDRFRTNAELIRLISSNRVKPGLRAVSAVSGKEGGVSIECYSN